MALTAAELNTQITALETRIATFAGITRTTFADQATDFDLDAAHRELARLRRSLDALATTPTRTRFAATSKGV